MILDELVLHDFGVYGGRQRIPLTPEKTRPIILFGGLNGGGKTTLLDALQLCLYGPSARCSNRSNLTYEEFLRRSVHRGAVLQEAAIELAFRHTSNGKEQEFRLHRSWVTTPTSYRENFYVLRDGNVDKMATEHWAEQVEDFIPARIAHLFLFDGEKVESYAELDGAPALIFTAIQNLLGLDIVERLQTDLLVLERRKRSDNKPPSEASPINDVRAKVASQELERSRLVKERATAANALDRRRADLKVVEDRYRREGGILFEKRVELEADLVAIDKQLAAVQRELRDLAAGCAPMMMVRDLLEAIAERNANEEAYVRGCETTAAVADEHAAIMKLPAIAKLSLDDRRSLKADLERRLDQRRGGTDLTLELKLTPDARGHLVSLLGGELVNAAEQLASSRAKQKETEASLEHARNALAASPSSDIIAEVVTLREGLQAEVARLVMEQSARDDKIALLERELSHLREQEARLSEAEARERFAREDVTRMLHHSAKVRDTLGRFREAIIRQHVARIERLVLESFHQLIRKQSLVADLRIDPQTFVLELRGADGHVVTADRLSAGERQLLAIAILWGLGRSSGRPLPTVIDTPLGRLDSIHRDHLVKRYFPRASHQVLLLSTDEEITGNYYQTLKPSISRTYHLRFDEPEGRTIVENGYLAEEARRAD
jgi:DNA sulfur modification protein DndD